MIGTRHIRLAKEVSWIVIGQVVTVAGSLVLVRVLTEYLNPTQYGQLALGLTIAGLVNQVVMGGITSGIGRYYSIATEKLDLGGYLHAARYLLAYATAVVVIIGLLLIATLYWLGYSQWIGLAVAALVFSVLSSFNSTLNGIQSAARHRAIVAFHGGLDAWLKIGLAVGVMLWLGTSSTAVVIGYACSSLLITASQLIFLRRTIPSQGTSIHNRQRWAPQIWAYSLPFSTWGAFTWMQQVSDRWAMQAFASTADAGKYAVIFQLGFTPIALITGLATSFLGPILYQRSGDATDPARNKNVHLLGWRISLISIAATLIMVPLTYFSHDWLFGLLVAVDYRSSSYLLPWLVLAGGVFAAGQLLALKLESEMKTSTIARVKIIAALIGTLLNVIGAAFFKVEGVVGALVVFSLVYYILMAARSR